VAQLGTWTAEQMSIGGVITAIKRQVSKKSGNEFARITVEDFAGSAEMLVFPEAWAAMSDRVRTDVPVLVKGGYSKRDQDADHPTFIVESVTRLAELRAAGQFAISLDLDPDAGLPADVMRDVRAVADAHPGAAPLELRWRGPDGSPARLRSASLRLSTAGPALLELRALLGTERVRLVRGS
jgi:DNA polymerase III subunit alpha